MIWRVLWESPSGEKADWYFTTEHEALHWAELLVSIGCEAVVKTYMEVDHGHS